MHFKLCEMYIGNLVHITFTLFDMHTFDGEGGGGSENSFLGLTLLFYRIVPVLFFKSLGLSSTIFSILLWALSSTYYTNFRCVDFKSQGPFINCSIH